MQRNNNWSKNETIIAFNIYCKIPFKNCSKTNPMIIKYAKILGRTPSALTMKIGNLGRLDPELKKQGIVGLTHGSKIEEEVWQEFNGNWEKLSFESEKLIAQLENESLENKFLDERKIFPPGIEKERLIQTRVNQSFFRSSVLSSYDMKCCISGISVPELLIASHIKPWKKDPDNRTNPRNGLCLNAIYDKAFDKGLISIKDSYEIIVSPILYNHSNEISIKELFLNIDGKRINLPNKFLPSQEFLSWHYTNLFKH